ncbi:MAG: hypothetical protein HKN62_14370 [Phycisphaerales bacterium]|nr:hypothetical protein [Phycisphaerales bacterium]
MPLIVDTYNVLHVSGVLPPDLAGIETADLARLIAASRYRREPATLVCDGTRPPDAGTGAPPGIDLVYAGPGRSADDEIIRRIRGSSVPRRLLLVTSDRAIMREARKRRCRILSSEAFLAQLADDHTHPPAGSAAAETPAGDVDHWLSVFGLPESPSPDDDANPHPDNADERGRSTTPRVVNPEPESGTASDDSESGSEPEPPLGAALPRHLIDEAAALWKSDREHRR